MYREPQPFGQFVATKHTKQSPYLLPSLHQTLCSMGASLSDSPAWVVVGLLLLLLPLHRHHHLHQ
jgi:hypothetical protein